MVVQRTCWRLVAAETDLERARDRMREPRRPCLVVQPEEGRLTYGVGLNVTPVVLSGGRIIASGGPELALRLEKEGYDQVIREAAA